MGEKRAIVIGIGVALFFMTFGALLLRLRDVASTSAWSFFLEGIFFGGGLVAFAAWVFLVLRACEISAHVQEFRRRLSFWRTKMAVNSAVQQENAEKGSEEASIAKVPTLNNSLLAPLAVDLDRTLDYIQIRIFELQREERRLREILHEMRSAVFLFDDRGLLRFANRAVASLVVHRLDDLLGKPYGEVLRNFDFVEMVEDVYRFGRESERELHVYYPEERIVRIHVVPLIAKTDGILGGVFLAATDVTEIRRLERVRSEFVQNVSHELKTPVTAIRGFAETLLDGALGDPEVARSFLEIILRESERLERLIADILDLSRIERTPKLSLTDVRLTEVFHDVYAQLESRFVQRGLRFENRISEGFVLEADPDRLRQIVLNLMANAVQYNRERGYVAVEAWEDDRFSYFSVEDSGIGIPTRDLGRIFERFYRVDKARSRDSGGTGLGLAIVKHLVEAHRGMISVLSEEGLGTVFTIAFPRGVVLPEKEEPEVDACERKALSPNETDPAS